LFAPANVPAFREQSRNVVEVSQLGSAGEPLQAIERERKVLVFQGSIEENGRLLSQSRRREE
jgi:hypothetical protein